MAGDGRVGRTGGERSGLLSVLYALLEGAGDYEPHIRDAERAFDRELADFLRELLAGRASMGGV